MLLNVYELTISGIFVTIFKLLLSTYNRDCRKWHSRQEWTIVKIHNLKSAIWGHPESQRDSSVCNVSLSPRTHVKQLNMEAQTCNPNTREAQAGVLWAPWKIPMKGRFPKPKVDGAWGVPPDVDLWADLCMSTRTHAHTHTPTLLNMWTHIYYLKKSSHIFTIQIYNK